MKKILIMILLLSLIVLGCNKNVITLNESEVIDISYHVFEKVYTNAIFFSKVAITLDKIDSLNNRKLEDLINYVDGYKTAMQRVALYKDMEKIVLDNTVSRFYNQELLNDTKTILKDLDLLVFQLSRYINDQLNQPIDPKEIKQISTHLHNLSRNLYPQMVIYHKRI